MILVTETAEMMWYDSCCSNTTYFMKIRVNRSVKGKAHIIFQAYELLLPSACSAFQLSGASPSMWTQNNHLFHMANSCRPHPVLSRGTLWEFRRWPGNRRERPWRILSCPVLPPNPPKSPRSQNTVRPCCLCREWDNHQCKKEAKQSICFCATQLVKHWCI